MAHVRFDVCRCIDVGICFDRFKVLFLALLGHHMAPSGSHVAPKIRQVAPNGSPKDRCTSHLRGLDCPRATCFQELPRALPGSILIDVKSIWTPFVAHVWQNLVILPTCSNRRISKTQKARPSKNQRIGRNSS